MNLLKKAFVEYYDLLFNEEYMSFLCIIFCISFIIQIIVSIINLYSFIHIVISSLLMSSFIVLMILLTGYLFTILYVYATILKERYSNKI